MEREAEPGSLTHTVAAAPSAREAGSPVSAGR